MAAEVMIPIALALLLAFFLSPLVSWLTRRRLPKFAAISLTAVIGFGAISVVAWQITGEAIALLDELPSYESNLNRKIALLKNPQASGTMSRALSMAEKVWGDLKSTDAPSTTPTATAGPPRAPVAAGVPAGERSSFDVMRQMATILFRPLSTAGIVMVFVIAILFQADDLRSRLIRLISGGQLNIATEAVDDVARRVSRYLLAQLLVNTCFGLVIGVGLFFIGIPHAPLWGVLATLLRFIPFLGPLIAVVFPLLLAVAVDPGWSMFFWTAGLFAASELITNNVIEVLVYGTSTGISTIALLIAAVFWTWLWGLPGLFLSTPLTVCLLVLGQYVPSLKFLGVVIGSDPPLTPAMDFYQKLLSMDRAELFTTAEALVAERSLAGFYDDVFVPALLMAEVDRHKGLLAETRQRFIFQFSRELIDELSVGGQIASVSAGEGVSIEQPAPEADEPVILGVPARDEADELVALMLAHLLHMNGLRAMVIPIVEGAETWRADLQVSKAVVFISALPPATLSAAVRATRRIRQISPAVHVLAGVWSSEANIEKLKLQLGPAGVNVVVTRLSEAVLLLKTAAHDARGKPTPRVAALGTAAKVPVLRPEEVIDAVLREAASDFQTPISLVSVLEVDREFWKPTAGNASTPTSTSESPPAEGVLASDQLQVIEDLAKDERLSQDVLFLKRGVRFLATAPLRTQAGHHVGNLCVLDTEPHEFSESQREQLAALASRLIEKVELLNNVARKE